MAAPVKFTCAGEPTHQRRTGAEPTQSIRRTDAEPTQNRRRTDAEPTQTKILNALFFYWMKYHEIVKQFIFSLLLHQKRKSQTFSSRF
jgi:hypothetical protein